MSDENKEDNQTGPDTRKHFKLAREIISRWAKWKQAIGLSTLQNTCGRCGNLLHQTGICNKCDLEL